MSKPKDTSNQNGGGEKKSWEGRLKENAPLIFDGVVAVMALVGGWFLWAQLALTREQIHVGQRAYVMAHGAELKNPLTIGKPLHAGIDLTNYGQTPAIEVVGSGNSGTGIPEILALSLTP